MSPLGYEPIFGWRAALAWMRLGFAYAAFGVTCLLRWPTLHDLARLVVHAEMVRSHRYLPTAWTRSQS